MLGCFFPGSKKKSVLVLFFSKRKKRNFCETSVGKKTHVPGFHVLRGKQKQQDKRKMLGGVCKDWKKTVSQTTKKVVIDFGDWPPQKIFTNSVNSKQDILGHVW